MLQKTLGIVLHTLKYKDTSLIADIYTEVAGRASFMVSIPRSRKAAVKPVLFQPLALVELEADFRPNATIYKVKEAEVSLSFRHASLRSLQICHRLVLVGIPLSRPFARRRRTVRCLPICIIPSSGWMNAGRGLPISIWSS